MAQTTTVADFIAHFDTRLQTLDSLVSMGLEHIGDEAKLLALRLAPDMVPFGTQVAYTCNQPRNFSLFLSGKPPDNLSPDVATLEQARSNIADTRSVLASVIRDDSKLQEVTLVHFGPTLSANMSGLEYTNDFLLPNFYFHLVTAYAILRMSGAPLGKKDYMQHIAAYLRR
jgi:hypothetical protein